MRAFGVASGGEILAEFESQEVMMFTDLVQQIIALLVRVKEGEADIDGAVLTRLFPDAYAEASDEFRRFTIDDLIDRKIENAQGVLESFDKAGVRTTGDGDVTLVRLDREYSMYWLGTLTDLRLVLATNLGIGTEAAAVEGADNEYVQSLYEWFGFTQGSLIEALEEVEGISG
jgi:ribosomal protein S18 acetylase RimI-like enzyme